ncbi:glycosyltransferase family 39 protein [Desulfurococcaceae archaeon MEX13E-LK6-19]|nr:glycosyltransferase family 39 protein [Desulfurococcaceae archaeon MEX13E-LK6-19]
MSNRLSRFDKEKVFTYVSIVLLLIIVSYYVYSEMLFVEAITNDVLSKGDEGYISDEIWYVDAARNILHKIFGIDPRTPCGECYTVFLYENATAMPPALLDIAAKKANVEILDKYVRTGKDAYIFLYVNASSRSNLEAFIKELDKLGIKTRDYVRGWIYGKAKDIDKYLNTEHPPLVKYIIALSMILFEDKPLSWRIPSIVAGALILVFAYLVTREILRQRFGRAFSSIAALVPPILLVFDPVHKYLSALALLDIYVGLLSLIAFYILVKIIDDNKRIFSVVSASTAKFSGLFIGIAHVLEKFVWGKYEKFSDRIFDTIYLLVKYFMVFIIVQVIISIPLIAYLGPLEWFNQAIPGAFRWHTSIKHEIGHGPVVSTPLDWVLGKNSFVLYYWSNGEPLVARGNWSLYLLSLLMAIMLIPLAIVDKTYRKAWLGFIGVYGGYVLLWILGGRTQYSYYLAQIAPFFYINLVVGFACMLPKDFIARYKTGLRTIKEFLWLEKYHGVVETEKLIGITLIVVAIGLSTILHAPWSEPRIYSDVYSIYWSIYGSPQQWYGPQLTYGVPYIDYRFPYMPGQAWVFMITTMTRLFLGYDRYLGIDKGFYAYYVFNALLSFVAAYIILDDLLFLGRRTSRARRIPLYLYAILPSIIVYGVYSWDIIALMFLLRSFRMFIEGEYKYVGVFTAIATLFNPLYSLVLLLYLYELRRNSQGIIYYFLLTILIGYTPLLLNPASITDVFNNFFGHYIEGSWLLLVAPTPSDPLIINIGWIMAFTIGLVIVLLPLKASDAEGVYGKLVLLLSITILLSPLYKPQYNLIIAVLWVPILDTIYTPILVLQDLSATTVILTWFTSNPMDKFSVPQIANYVKCILLLILILYHFTRYIDISTIQRAFKGFRERLAYTSELRDKHLSGQTGS